MLFLLRLAFWMLLICMLLPGSQDDKRRLLSSAERTVHDVRGFCERNPEVCEDAKSTLAIFMAKLKNGAALLQVWISGPESGQGVTQSNFSLKGSQPDHGSVPLSPKWQDSLTPLDKQTPWAGPSRS